MTDTTSAMLLSHGARVSHGARNSHGANASHGALLSTDDGDNPMLSEALVETRLALLQGRRPDQLGSAQDRHGKPKQLEAEAPGQYTRWGDEPRAALLMFELSSTVEFDCSKAGVASLRLKAAPAELSAAQQAPDASLIASLARPTQDYFLAQLADMEALTTQREVRVGEILVQTAPTIPFFASVLGLQAGRHRRSLEFINAALAFNYTVLMRFKHALACRRPHEYSPTIQPIIEVPQHGAFPSGHCTEAHLMANLFTALVPGIEGAVGEVYLRRLACRIAGNRVIAGVHFPVDGVAGRLLGDAMANHLLAAVQGKASRQAGVFALDEAQLASPHLGCIGEDDGQFSGPGCSAHESSQVARLPLLAELWRLAKEEWA